MTITDAQREMRFAYFGGGLGILTSGLVWLAAAVVALVVSPVAAMVTVFVGGMLIHPIAVALCKALGRPGAASKENPLEASAKEVTALFVLCMPLAYVAAQTKMEWFFPGMLLLIGGRYLTFQTLYGAKVFWTVGAALVVAGFALMNLKVPFAVGPFVGALIELGFAWVVINEGRKESVPTGSIPAGATRA